MQDGSTVYPVARTDRLNDENLRRLFVESNLEEVWKDEGGVTSQGWFIIDKLTNEMCRSVL